MPNRYAVISDGAVTNVILATAETAPVGAIESDVANIGDTYSGGVFTPRTQTVAEARAERRRSIRAEAMRRIADRMGDVMSDPDMLGLVRTIWLSIAPAARQPNTDMQWLIDVTQAVQTALTAVNNATTVAEVDAVTVNWPA